MTVGGSQSASTGLGCARVTATGDGYESLSTKDKLKNATCIGGHADLILNTLRPSYWHQPGSEPLSPLTVGQLVDQSADKFGHREALVSLHQNRRLTFQQLREQSDRLAAGLLQLGLEPGDRLGLWIPNIAEWFIVNFAAARAGLILVNINPANQSAELKYCLNKVGIKALITVDKFKTQRYPELISAIVPEVTSAQQGDIRSDHVPSLKSVIVISEDQFPGSFKYDDVMASGTEEYLQKVRLLQNKTQPDEGCNIYFTSGTTGSPKAALLSHHNSVNNAYYTGKRLGLHLKWIFTTKSCNRTTSCVFPYHYSTPSLELLGYWPGSTSDQPQWCRPLDTAQISQYRP
uniref:Medium-chain acyl-CoA ligase ACSF2, mitochondrial n=1 Tax=Timema shepardi TaxID=629360 RepID=A0A7R9B8T0_TIMSH|nr:unnamed protein product [Timema shepardi]